MNTVSSAPRLSGWADQDWPLEELVALLESWEHRWHGRGFTSDRQTTYMGKGDSRGHHDRWDRILHRSRRLLDCYPARNLQPRAL